MGRYKKNNMAKKFTFNDFSKGVGNTFPFLYTCGGIDLTELPFVKNSEEMQEQVNSSTLTDLEKVNWFIYHKDNMFALCGNGKLLKYTTSWGLNNTFSSCDGEGLQEFENKLFVATRYDIAMSNDGGTSWDVDWWTTVALGTSLTHADYHPMKEVRGKLLIGNGTKVATWDGITANNAALTLPTGYTISSIETTPYYASILATKGAKSSIFLWDTVSAQYNYILNVPDVALAQITSKSDLYVINNKGILFVHNGDRMDKVAEIPDGIITASFKVLPSGITLKDDEILISVSHLDTGQKRALKGIWAYNIKTGAIYHKYYLQTRELSTNAACYAIYNSQGVIYLSEKNNSGIYRISTTETGIYTKKNSKGSFIILPMNNDGRKKRLIKLLIDYFRLKEIGESITVSYSDKTDFIVTSAANTYTADANAFTAYNLNPEIGDMIMVGSGARACEITFVSANNGSNNYSVSPAFSGPLASGDILYRLNFKKIGTIDYTNDANTISKMLRLGKYIDDYYIRLDFKNGSNKNEIIIRDISVIYNESKN